MIATIIASFCNLGNADDPPLGVFPEPGTGTLLVPAVRFPGLSGVTGLAADAQYVYAAGQVWPVPGAPEENSASFSELLTFDRTQLQLHARYRFQLARDVHSLAAVDGRVMAVSTGTDALVELAIDDGRVVAEHVHWRADPIGTGADELHLNAVVRRGDTLLISGFGRRQSRSWDLARNGFVRQIAIRDGAPGPFLAENLVHPHSLLVEGNDVVLCESRNRAVRTLRDVLLAALPGYTRGLCRAGSMIYVGTSVGRRHSRSGSAKLGNPHGRGAPAGECAMVGVAVPTWQAVSRVVLTPVAREIYELLSLNPPATLSPRHWRRRAALTTDGCRDN